MENNNIKGRFGMTVRKLLIEQKKTLLIMAGSYLGFCAILGLWGGFMGAVPSNDNFVLYILLGGLACALVASKMFFDMVNKEGRTALFMSPATASDKFLPRLIAVIPGMLILVALGYLVFGYSDILAIGFTYDTWVPLPNPFQHTAENYAAAVCGLIAMFLFNESIFIFGSVAWPRKSFLKSLGIFALIQIVLSFCAMGFVKSGIRIQVVDGEALLWTIIGIVTAIALAIMYGAFWKFKRSTVI